MMMICGDDYYYYYVQVCGEGRILSNSKPQAFKHMDCQCFCLVLALFAPHANGVIVVVQIHLESPVASIPGAF